jgi:predicted membrane chloride channel (bestrophin family)
MTPADWDHHQSWHRHCLEPRMYLRVLRVLSVIEAWVLGVTVAAGLYATHLQPRPGWWALVHRDYMALFTLAAVALALLITFRTNTAHGRWWEVRGGWGGGPWREAR